VVVAISNSGSAPDLLAAVDAARAAGADVIAICGGQSPLARKATLCLAVDHAEDSSTFLSMISRILQLLLIDIMSVGISVDAHKAREDDKQERKLLISHLDS
jgi:glucokinase